MSDREHRLRLLQQVAANMRDLLSRPSENREERLEAAGVGLLLAVEALAPDDERGLIAADIHWLYQEIVAVHADG